MNSYQLKSGAQVIIRKNNRARRVIIKVRHGQAELVIPQRVNIKKAIQFLNTKEDWILHKLAAFPVKIKLNTNVNFPLFNKECQIFYAGLRGKSVIIDNELLIYGDALAANKKIKKLLYEKLKSEIEKIAAEKAKIFALTYKKITIRNNVSRWGSCSTSGNLSFCWRLIFAPCEVVEYLVCHELAHLKQMNHSPKFWLGVAALYPNYKTAESWLKKNGNSLYLYE